jgi:hypothetical protein
LRARPQLRAAHPAPAARRVAPSRLAQNCRHVDRTTVVFYVWRNFERKATQADAKETHLWHPPFVSRRIILQHSEKPRKKAALELEILFVLSVETVGDDDREE